jgi:hypothetical protein
MSEQLRSWLMSWAWSGQSAAEVVRSAQAFVADGHRDPLIEELARASGNVANAERAVRRVLPTTGPETIEVGGGDVTLMVPLATMFRWVRDNHPEHFRSHFGASQACVRRFWEQLAGTPDGADFWAKHPFLRGRAPADLSHHVPLVMHDDAGPVSKHNSAFVRSFHSILGVGRELEARFLICTFMKRAECSDRTWPLIMRSFEDLAGDVGEGEWGGVLLFMSSDLDFACNELGLRHFNGVKMCCFCNADTTEPPITILGSMLAGAAQSSPMANLCGICGRRDTPWLRTRGSACTRIVLTCCIRWTTMG